ncbi:sulfatase, partial [bacterium]|nr:sulfatase [candidate division CSSED10-310 bacterium]
FLIAGIDTLGFMTHLPEPCRQTQGLPSRFAPDHTLPDVLLISIDTCRADALGSYGNSRVRTPVLDQLARDGAIIEDVITSIPITTSAHATMMTGWDPPVHGSRFNAVPIDPSIRTLAEILRDNGYATGGFVGAFPVTHEVSGLGRGFDIFDQLLTPSRGHPLLYRTTILAGLSRFGPLRPAERKWFRTVPVVRKWWTHTTGTPRFTFVHFYDPHFPYHPLEPFSRDYLSGPPQYRQSVFYIADLNASGGTPEPGRIEEYRSLYYGEIAGVDHAIGLLLEDLKKSGAIDRTVVIVTADHGESLNEHGYYFAHGEHLYDPSLRVPLIVRGPGVKRSGGVVRGQYPLRYVFGIVHELLGVRMDPAVRHHLPGCDVLASILNGGQDPVPVIHSFCESGAGIYTSAHVPRDDRIRKKKRAIRSLDAKMILHEDGRVIRYDLMLDPAEIRPEGMEQEQAGGMEGEHVLVKDSVQPREDLRDRLVEYIQHMDPPNRRPPHLPDEDALKQLRSLGYID